MKKLLPLALLLLAISLGFGQSSMKYARLGELTTVEINDITLKPGWVYTALNSDFTPSKEVINRQDGNGWVDRFPAGGGSADGLGPDGVAGDVTVGNGGTTLTINNGAVNAQKIADNAINSSNKINDGIILNDDLFVQNGTRTAGHLVAISSVSNRFDLIDPSTLGGGSTLLPSNELALGTQTTNATYENRMNTVNFAGTVTVNIATDATYNHAIGTMLWFNCPGDATLTIQPESAVSGFAAVTIISGQTALLRKAGSNNWELVGVFYKKVIESNPLSRTNPETYTQLYGQTQNDYDTDGTPAAGELVLITDAAPADVENATATLTLDYFRQQDNTATDTATYNLSGVKAGATYMVLVNQAAEPAITGATKLPKSANFIANTEMLMVVVVFNTTVKYFFLEW